MQDPSKRADFAAKRIRKKKGEVVGRRRKKTASPSYKSWRELMMQDLQERKRERERERGGTKVVRKKRMYREGLIEQEGFYLTLKSIAIT